MPFLQYTLPILPLRLQLPKTNQLSSPVLRTGYELVYVICVQSLVKKFKDYGMQEVYICEYMKLWTNYIIVHEKWCALQKNVYFHMQN